MRIAALSDIHGNLPALGAVFDHVNRQRVDLIVVVGDVVVGSPDSAACWKTVRDLECPLVRGNGESYLARFGTLDADPRWETEQFGPIQWGAAEFSREERRAFGDLPLTYRPPDTDDILFFHAMPRSEYGSMKAYTSEEELGEIFSGVAERYLVRGHQHNPQVRLWNDRAIINCGSVGLPVDYNPDAQYLLLDRRAGGWHVRHQVVPYDVDAVLRRFQETDYLKVAGPMGRLHMRAVATGTNQTMPFLRYYKQWQEEGDIALGEAVDRFLNLF
mgnify:CR=1 FL=1